MSAKRRSKTPLGLAAGLLVPLLAGCGGVPTPAVVESAAARLDSREATQLASVRPRLLREARGHLIRARRAVLDEDADAAELYGHLALQRYETAAGFTARDLVDARLGAMDAAVDRITEQADALAAERSALLKVKAAEDRLAALDRETAGESEARKASRRRLVQARQRQAEAVAAGAAHSAPGPFGAGQTLLESGIEALQSDLFAEAREAAAGAIARFDEAIARAAELRITTAKEATQAQSESAEAEATRDAVTAAELARAEALGRGLDRRDPPRYEKGAALVELARRSSGDRRYADARRRAAEAVETLAHQPDEGSRSAPAGDGIGADAAGAAIVDARTRRATALGAGLDRRCPDVFRGVDALIELAADRQAAGEAAEALTAATRAQERLDTCEAAPSPTADALRGVRPDERAAAEQRIVAAQQALARARAARVDPARLQAGAGLIGDARGWYATGGWDRAGTLAEQAREMLTTALPSAGAPDPSLAEARAALERSRALARRYADRSDDPLHGAAQRMQAEAERLLAAGRGDEALRVAHQAAATWQSIAPRSNASPTSSTTVALGAAPRLDGPAPSDDWRPAYREILATLSLRDRADAMASGAQAREAVQTGDRELAEARRAYQNRAYGDARRTTALAAAAFRRAVDGSPPPTLPASAPDTPATAAGTEPVGEPKPPPAAVSAAVEPTDETRRAAELEAVAAAAAQAALDTAAADRAAAEAAAQAADAQSAERAEAERQLTEAREAEAAAKAALAEAEAQRGARDKAREAEEKRRAEARSWVDGARRRQVECLQAGCDTRDAVSWGRADEALSTAESALHDGAFDSAIDAARRSIALMDTSASAPAPFVVPTDQREVRREGDRLQMRTRLRFRPGKATLRAGADGALDALARVITENQAAIGRVRLVGFTDDSGPAEANLALSTARAEAVRDALIARGVPIGHLSAEGRGEAKPAFDNRTAEGRRKNRRVEIRLELKGGE